MKKSRRRWSSASPQNLRRGGVTVRELLIEGAELALERRESRADLETLKTRSAAAKARMRRGYFALEAATEPLPK